ncbi:hypothetical protein [Schaalia canis]|uniref:hypothetical protein n=1 Tax=Schaalia canis TaxID=100469 RepID=UPI003B836E0E
MEAAAGRRAHEMYPLAVGQDQGYLFNRAIRGSNLRPDALNYRERIVRELKPDTPSGRSQGKRQLAMYVAELRRTTGEEWTPQLDLYAP